MGNNHITIHICHSIFLSLGSTICKITHISAQFRLYLFSNITHTFKRFIFGISIKFPSKRDQTMLCLDIFLKNVVIFTRCPTAELPRAVKKIPQTSLGVSVVYFDQYRPINQKMQ